MRVIAKRTLIEFWESDPKYKDAKSALEIWYKEAAKSVWKSPQDIKAQYRSASVLKSNRVVFNIAGNKYRLVVKINYPYGVIYIRFIGSHQQYDAIDVEII
ncbi:type II toxin-antitoxin system HigB family toxin [Deltaproteobacteria bacterium TL4]